MISLTVVIVAAASSIGITRAEIIESAEQFVEYRWEMKEEHQSADCDVEYKSYHDIGTQFGVPYKWGGWDTVEQFAERLGIGDAAGSHRDDDVLSCVTGVDCSGFITIVWGRTDKKYSTNSFAEISKTIDVEDILPGDAFNKPGSHVVLYIGETESGQPLFYEASGGASRVRLHNGWSYLDGYTPIRYNHIEEESSSTSSTSSIALGQGAQSASDSEVSTKDSGVTKGANGTEFSVSDSEISTAEFRATEGAEAPVSDSEVSTTEADANETAKWAEASVTVADVSITDVGDTTGANATTTSVAGKCEGSSDVLKDAYGRCWSKESSERYEEWEDARQFCSELRAGRLENWRLPTIDELRSIYDKSRRPPLTIGVKLEGPVRWSSTMAPDSERHLAFVFRGQRASMEVIPPPDIGAKALCINTDN